MILAHGTRLYTAERALKQGLRPRAAGRPGNYPAYPSGRGRVYLTAAYALYFAQVAARDRRVALVAVDSNVLAATGGLLPDEDALEQTLGYQEGAPAGRAARTRWFRDHADKWAAAGYDYRYSLRALGNCAFKGTVAPSAITRIVHYNLDTFHEYLAMSDPTISFLNFAIMGPFYTELQRMLLGYSFDPEPITRFAGDVHGPARLAAWREAAERERRIIYDSGIDEPTAAVLLE